MSLAGSAGNFRFLNRLSLDLVRPAGQLVPLREAYMFRTKIFGLTLAILTLAFPLMLSAQVNTGTILGSVTDSSGAVLAHTKVTATNQDTGFTRSADTLDDGSFLIPLLPIGPRYQVTAERTGFKGFSQTGVELHLNEKLRIENRLQGGAASESVHVDEQAPLVDTQSAVGGEVVESERMTELPLNGRNPLQLAGLVPGVEALDTVATITLGNRAANFMSINGS